MAKSIERRLYEAARFGRGVRLSAEDVMQLVDVDDAILTRINNAAALEAGASVPGFSVKDYALTWNELKRTRLADDGV